MVSTPRHRLTTAAFLGLLIATGIAYATRDTWMGSWLEQHEGRAVAPGDPQVPAEATHHHGGHDHDGQAIVLGSANALGARVGAVMVGGAEPSGVGTFVITVEGPDDSLPPAARVWAGALGDRDGRAIEVRTATLTPDGHQHLLLGPAPIDQQRLWIELVDDAGAAERVSFALGR